MFFSMPNLLTFCKQVIGNCRNGRQLRFVKSTLSEFNFYQLRALFALNAINPRGKEHTQNGWDIPGEREGGTEGNRRTLIHFVPHPSHFQGQTFLLFIFPLLCSELRGTSPDGKEHPSRGTRAHMTSISPKLKEEWWKCKLQKLDQWARKGDFVEILPGGVKYAPALAFLLMPFARYIKWKELSCEVVNIYH